MPPAGSSSPPVDQCGRLSPYASRMNLKRRSRRIDVCADALGIAKERRLAFRNMIEAFLEESESLAGQRLKWHTDRQPGEGPAQFAWRAYAPEAAAGTLHRGIIHGEDEPLYWKLIVWLRAHPMPKGIDIPTKPEWNTRQIEARRAKQGSTWRLRLRTEEQRIDEVLTSRCRIRAQGRRSPVSRHDAQEI
jgi:hypothetical protein